MKKSILTMVALLATGNAFAASYGTGTVARYSIGSDGVVSFSMTTPLSGTCNYFGDQFRFEGDTTTGKQRLREIWFRC